MAAGGEDKAGMFEMQPGIRRAKERGREMSIPTHQLPNKTSSTATAGYTLPTEAEQASYQPEDTRLAELKARIQELEKLNAEFQDDLNDAMSIVRRPERDTELAKLKARIQALETLVIEADSKFNRDGVPSEIGVAELSLVSMCAEGREAMDKLAWLIGARL